MPKQLPMWPTQSQCDQISRGIEACVEAAFAGLRAEGVDINGPGARASVALALAQATARLGIDLIHSRGAREVEPVMIIPPRAVERLLGIAEAIELGTAAPRATADQIRKVLADNGGR